MHMFPFGRFLYMPLTFVGCKSRSTTYRRHTILLVERHPRQKRVRNDTQDLPAKKRVKCALMILHDLKPTVEYKLVAQVGPSHRPMFTMAVEVNGQIFEGTAPTKREAKQAGRSRRAVGTSTDSIVLSGRESTSVLRSISRRHPSSTINANRT